MNTWKLNINTIKAQSVQCQHITMGKHAIKLRLNTSEPKRTQWCISERIIDPGSETFEEKVIEDSGRHAPFWFPVVGKKRQSLALPRIFHRNCYANCPPGHYKIKFPHSRCWNWRGRASIGPHISWLTWPPLVREADLRHKSGRVYFINIDSCSRRRLFFWCFSLNFMKQTRE